MPPVVAEIKTLAGGWIIKKNKMISFERLNTKNMGKELVQNIDNLYQRICVIIEDARNKVYSTANHETVKAYWNIGREIVE